MPKPKTLDIAWNPAPGYVLCRVVKREELQKNTGNLELPDNVGKVSDSVGVGEVLKAGGYDHEALKLSVEVAKLIGKDTLAKINETVKASGQRHPFGNNIHDQIKPGDLIAWMPFTDQLIEIDLVKYSLVGYDKIRAVRKAK